jgi:hypothetical protein
MDEAQLFVRESPYKPRRMLETVSVELLATHLEELSRKRDVWARAALLGTLPGAAIVIASIELIHRVCL